MKNEEVPALNVVSNWPYKPWWPIIAEYGVNFVNLGRIEDVLMPEGGCEKQKDFFYQKIFSKRYSKRYRRDVIQIDFIQKKIYLGSNK